MLVASIQHRFKQLPGFYWLISILALIVGAVISLLVVHTDYGLLLLAAIGGGILALLLTIKPSYSVYILVFMLYTRFSDVLVNFHGAPSIAKIYIPFLLLLVIVRWLLYNDQPQGFGRMFIIIIYGALGLASIFYAADPSRVTYALSDFVKDIIIVMVIINFMQSGSTLRRIIWTLLAAGIFMGTISTIQQFTGTFENPYWGFAQSSIKNIVGETNDYRLGGPDLSSNFYSQFLLVLVPLALDRIWREKSKWGRAIATYALIVCTLTIIFTFSRGSFIGLLVSLAVMLLYRRPGLKFILFTVLLGALMMLFVPKQYIDRVTTLTELLPGEDTRLVEDSSIRGRLSENASAWLMFKDHPILGVGLKNFNYHYQSYARHLGLDPRREERSPHSLYLEVASELGMVGIIWLIGLQGFIFSGLYRAHREFIRADKPEYADIALAFGAGLLSFLITSIFLHLAYPRYFWLLYGIALAIPQTAHFELAQVRRNEPARINGDPTEESSPLSYNLS